jgi:uncharacterized protein
MEVKYRTALITGGASGLGFAFARALAKNGTNLILISRNEDNLEKAKEMLENDFNVSVWTMPGDLTKQECCEKIEFLLDSEFLYPDLIINNAGIGYHGGFIKKKFICDYKIINLNITSLTSLCKLSLKWMLPARRGTILNISSTVAFRKSPGWSVYSATKTYILALTRSLAEEYKDSGIQFSVVCPGKTDTDFDKNAGLQANGNSTKDSPEFVAEYTLKQISTGKTLIIPGFKNKLKYFMFRYLPDFSTDWIIGRL